MTERAPTETPRTVSYADESERDELWHEAADEDGTVGYDMLTTDRTLSEQGVEDVRATAESHDATVVGLDPVAGRVEAPSEEQAASLADDVVDVVGDPDRQVPARTYQQYLAGASE